MALVFIPHMLLATGTGARMWSCLSVPDQCSSLTSHTGMWRLRVGRDLSSHSALPGSPPAVDSSSELGSLLRHVVLLLEMHGCVNPALTMASSLGSGLTLGLLAPG